MYTLHLSATCPYLARAFPWTRLHVATAFSLGVDVRLVRVPFSSVVPYLPVFIRLLFAFFSVGCIINDQILQGTIGLPFVYRAYDLKLQ